MARTGNSREKGKDKEDETKKKKTAKQKKIAKQSPRPSTVSRVLDKVLALVCLVTILARVDFLTAFGVGTGVNKTHLNPITVLSYYVSNTDALRNVDPRLDIACRKMMIAAAVPGEALSDLVDGTDTTNARKAKGSGKSKSGGEDYFARALRWTKKTAKHRGLAKAIPGNHLLVGGAAMVLLGTFLALFLPDVGFTCFLGGTLMLYVGATTATSKVAVTYGVTHIAIPLAVYALVLQQRLAAIGQDKTKRD